MVKSGPTRDRYKTELPGQVSGQTILIGREEVQGGDVNIGSFGTASVFLGIILQLVVLQVLD